MVFRKVTSKKGRSTTKSKMLNFVDLHGMTMSSPMSYSQFWLQRSLTHLQHMLLEVRPLPVCNCVCSSCFLPSRAGFWKITLAHQRFPDCSPASRNVTCSPKMGRGFGDPPLCSEATVGNWSQVGLKSWTIHSMKFFGATMAMPRYKLPEPRLHGTPLSRIGSCAP